jgi:hypothetical protein
MKMQEEILANSVLKNFQQKTGRLPFSDPRPLILHTTNPREIQRWKSAAALPSFTQTNFIELSIEAGILLWGIAGIEPTPSVTPDWTPLSPVRCCQSFCNMFGPIRSMKEPETPSAPSLIWRLLESQQNPRADFHVTRKEKVMPLMPLGSAGHGAERRDQLSAVTSKSDAPDTSQLVTGAARVQDKGRRSGKRSAWT